MLLRHESFRFTILRQSRDWFESSRGLSGETLGTGNGERSDFDQKFAGLFVSLNFIAETVPICYFR